MAAYLSGGMAVADRWPNGNKPHRVELHVRQRKRLR
jgi:hypothetical protein